VCYAVIWDALKAAAASDVATAKVILESAGVVVSTKDMTVCYDERGESHVMLMQHSLHGPRFAAGCFPQCKKSTFSAQ
jgi:hypothetical protein